MALIVLSQPERIMNTLGHYILLLMAWGYCIVNKEIEENKSVIRDMLCKNITRSEIIDLYRSIQECEVSKDDFVDYLINIIGRCYGKKCVKV